MASASLTKLLGLKLTVNQLKNLCIAKSSGIIQTLGATSLVTVIHSVHRCPQRAKKEQKKNRELHGVSPTWVQYPRFSLWGERELVEVPHSLDTALRLFSLFIWTSLRYSSNTAPSEQ